MIVANLQDAYHALILAADLPKILWNNSILQLIHLLYLKIGMDLCISPAIWQQYINKVLENIPERMNIMVDAMICSTYQIIFKL